MYTQRVKFFMELFLVCYLIVSSVQPASAELSGAVSSWKDTYFPHDLKRDQTLTFSSNVTECVNKTSLMQYNRMLCCLFVLSQIQLMQV